MTPTASQRAGDASCALVSDQATSANENTPPGLTESHPRAREPFLDPWRTAKGEPAQRLLEFVRCLVAEREKGQPRTRARKPQDQRRWDEMIEAIVCGLMLVILRPSPSGRVVQPLGKKHYLPKRYQRPTQSERLGVLLKHLHDLQIIELEKGQVQGEATALRPTPVLEGLVALFEVRLAHLGHRKPREVIILKRTKGHGKRKTKTLVDYVDTPETVALRAEVVAINHALTDADLDYLGIDVEGDTSNRTLRRYFSIGEHDEKSFDRCGRLFGGFWQRLKRGARADIRINGEGVVEIDYSAAFTHIAFALAGVSAPTDRDLYDVPGLEGMARCQRKAALNTLYFDTGMNRRRWPTEFDLETIDAETGEALAGIDPKFTPRLVRAAVLAHYPALAAVIGQGLGLTLMHTESRILLKAMSMAGEAGVVVLPLHDALIVPLSASLQVVTIMREAAMAIINQEIPVKRKT